MSQLKIGVIGAGHLGKIHIRLLASQPEIDLVAVAEPSPLCQQQVLDQYDLEVVSDYRKLIGRVDAAVIATPTRFHYDIARDLLEHGVHVLIEKPLTDSVSDARSLVQLATETGCVGAVGHVERFNPAIRMALQKVGQPKFVQAARMSGFTFRSTDIGVVHDLMIHDIDLVNNIFAGTPEQVLASGITVLGDHEDIAQSVIRFSCGGVANLTATRCSFKNERSFQIFGTKGYANVDLASNRVTCVQIPGWVRNRTYDLLDMTPEQQSFIRDELFTKILPKSEVEVTPINAILEEQQDWIRAIRTGVQPQVTLEQGAEAVAIADQVIESIQQNNWNQPETSTAGLSLFQAAPIEIPVTPVTKPRRSRHAA